MARRCSDSDCSMTVSCWTFRLTWLLEGMDRLSGSTLVLFSILMHLELAQNVINVCDGVMKVTLVMKGLNINT